LSLKKTIGVLILINLLGFLFQIQLYTLLADTGNLGEFYDNYNNYNWVQARYRTVRNTTFNAMELEYTSGGALIYQDFVADWFEIDPFNMLFQTVSKSRWENVQRDTDLAVTYRDFGVGNIDDFTYRFDLNISFCNTGAVTSRIGVFTVSEVVDDWNDAKTANWEMSGINMYHVALGTTYKLRCRYAENGGGALGNNSSNMNVGTMYYIEVIKDDTLLKARIFSDSSFTVLIEAITVTLANDNTYRYVLAPQSNGLAAAANDDSSGSINNLWLGDTTSGGYYLTGYYYTPDLMVNISGTTIALLYNCSLNSGGVTVEFSNDNSSWVDHNGAGGSDNLVNGFESENLVDLSYNNLYMRFNFTRGGVLLTPRIYQIRVVSSIASISGGGGENLVLVTLIFVPVGLVLMYVVGKRK